MTDTTAIRTIHQTSCRAHKRNGATGRCNCTPAFMPEPWDAATGRKVRGRVCSTLREARNERNTMRAALRAASDVRSRGGDAAVWEVIAEEVASGIDAGTILNRQDAAYKPSAALGIVRLLRSRLVRDDCPLVGKTLREVTVAVLQDLVAWLRQEGLSPNSVRRHVDAVGVVWRYADETYGLTGANPIPKVKKPKGEARREPAMPSDASALIAALPVERGMQALWATASLTGMRRGEILGLTWERVDLTKREIRVEQTWNEKTRTFGDPKSAASRRVIPVSAALAVHLRAWMVASGRRSGLVFSDDGVRPMDFAAASRRARTQWRRKGLKPVGLHQLRHGCGTAMAAAGVDIRTVQAVLGHADITTTARYIHERPEANRSALEQVASAMGPVVRAEESDVVTFAV